MIVQYWEWQKNGNGGYRPIIERDDNEYRVIYCCGCGKEVHARLTTGAEVYPHRPDLADLPFWKCDDCKNTVGCHHKTKDRTRPLGIIPTPEIKNARQHIHKILDPMWKGKGNKKRKKIYARLSKELGYEYHTAEVRSLDDARKVYALLMKMKETPNG